MEDEGGLPQVEPPPTDAREATPNAEKGALREEKPAANSSTPPSPAHQPAAAPIAALGPPTPATTLTAEQLAEALRLLMPLLGGPAKPPVALEHLLPALLSLNAQAAPAVATASAAAPALPSAPAGNLASATAVADIAPAAPSLKSEESTPPERTGPPPRPSAEKGRRRRGCWNCGQPAHSWVVCKVPQKVFCRNCGKAGVTKYSCPECHGPKP